MPSSRCTCVGEVETHEVFAFGVLEPVRRIEDYRLDVIDPFCPAHG